MSPQLLAYSYLACFVAFILLRGFFALTRPKSDANAPQHESRASHLFRTIVIIAQTALMAVYGFRTMFSLFPWIDTFALPVYPHVRILMLGLSVLALLGLVWVHATLGRHFSDRLNLQAAHTLVTTGPYRYVRHPMYSFLYLFFIASAVLSANGLIALCSLLLIGNIWVRISQEEKMLRNHFGQSFDEYAAKTARIIPFVL